MVPLEGLRLQRLVLLGVRICVARSQPPEYQAQPTPFSVSISPIVAARWGGSTFSARRPLLRKIDCVVLTA